MSIEALELSLRHSFIDKNLTSERKYQPALLVNDNKRGKKFLSNLLYELDTCDEFWISVAFVTTSGIATIINSLMGLQSRGIKGKVLVSQYLNFTQPEALKKINAIS